MKRRGDKRPLFCYLRMKEQVEKILAEKLEGSSLFPVDVRVSSKKIEVFVDGDTGVNINECAELSRYLHNELEAQGVDTGKYFVEISSPGIDYPLSSLREYKKNVGRKLQVRDKQNRIITGLLVYLDSERIVLTNKKKKEAISFADIKESKVVI